MRIQMDAIAQSNKLEPAVAHTKEARTEDVRRLPSMERIIRFICILLFECLDSFTAG
jgi:hypothetical protein